MAKRFTDTELWDKEWFMSLSPKHKLLMKYLFAKCDNAGVWTPNWVLAKIYTGEQVSAEDLDALKSQVEVLPDGRVWVKDFVQFQYGTLSEKCIPHQKIISLLAKHGILDRVVSRVHSRVDSTLKEEEEEEDKDKDLCNNIRNKKGTDFKFYVDLWNAWAKDHDKPQIIKLSDARKKHLNARVKEDAFELEKILDVASKSPYILKKDSTWFSFDWLIESENNYLKVLEGKFGYAGSQGKQYTPTDKDSWI